MFAVTSPSAAVRSPKSRRRVLLRAPIALALATAALSAAGAEVAAAAAPVPCTPTGTRFNCEFYPSAGAPVQAADGRVVGTLHRGTNWVLCQRVGGQVRSGAYYNNNWAWTLADNNAWGWVNAVYARGGDNNGPYSGVPSCGTAHGNPPGGSGAPTPPPPPAPPGPPPPPTPPANGARPLFEAPWPCGQSRDYYHHSSEVKWALDFNIRGASDLGTPAVASAAGTVISARNNGGYGREVVVDHGGGWSSRVAHLSRFSVRAGDTVVQGQEIGKVGTSGRSSGPHLHYEQILNKVRQPIVLHGQRLAYKKAPTRITARACR